MIRPILAAFAFACALAAAPAALAQQPAGVPIQVRTGEVYTIDITYTQTAEFGDESIEAVVRQVYALHIVDAESRRWRYVPVSLSYDFPEGLGAADGEAPANLAKASPPCCGSRPMSASIAQSMRTGAAPT
jgi:hypothetical protein